MSAAPLLRDYQKAGNDAALLARRAGKKSVVLVAPTGSGKRIMFIDMMLRAMRAGLRVGMLAHRRELILQPAADLRRWSIPFGVVMAGVRGEPMAPVQLLSVQTVTAREDCPWLDVIIIDEAHHATAATYAAILAAFPKAFVLGYTGTPERGDGTALGDAFEEMIVVTTVAAMQERFRRTGGAEGVCLFEHIGPLDGKKRTSAQGMADDPLAMYARLNKRVGRGKPLPAIFFGATVNHAYKLAEDLCGGGVRAACIEGETRNRQKILARYQAGDLDALTNVYCLTEGTDLPRTRVVCVARGCAVWSAWVQMGGRAGRPDPASGKRVAYILDPYGHTYEHGLLSDTPTFSLSGRAASLTAPLSAIRCCRACGAAFRSAALICPQCGARVPPPPLPKIKARPAAMGAITTGAVVDHGAQWKRYLELVYVAVLNGHKLGSAGYAFERQFGHWPRYTQAKRDEAVRLAEARIKENKRGANQAAG